MSEEYEKKSTDQNAVESVERDEIGPDSELHRGLKNRHAQMIS